MRDIDMMAATMRRTRDTGGDCADWLAQSMTDLNSLAEYRQRKATRGSGPQSQPKRE
jgi:hypothetical protein